jgi:hypothetical protein
MPIDRRTFVASAAAGALLGSRIAAAAAEQITPQTLQADSLYKTPFIDVDEWRDTPVRHRYVHGGFKDTELRFSMYFPPKEQYQGRFFHPVMHIAGNEKAALGRLAGLDGDSIGFAADSGGYLVESNMGAFGMAGPNQTHASAATAEYSRALAKQMYGGGRPYGYVYGGSGGGFKTIECAQMTTGVWDGYVPFIHGCPISMPNAFTVQAYALRVLKDKFAGIIDAIDPGGSGDMYAGLNAEEREALLEATRWGIPPRSWFAHERLSINYTGVFASLIGNITGNDPNYFEDFWKLPGYLGANPPESLKRARIQHEATVTRAITTEQARGMGLPVAIAAGTRTDALAAVQLSSLPAGNVQGAYLNIRSGTAQGKRVMVTGVVGNTLLLGGLFSREGQLQAGDAVEIDNSIYLATQTYHRHQVVQPEEYYVCKQFLNADGSPKYPQRPLLPNYRTAEARDRVQSGRFTGKMIVMECLMDEAAYPWKADWYHSKVRAALGPKIDDHYRLWYVDHAMHVTPNSYMTPSEGGSADAAYSPVNTRIISYAGLLQQALRDMVAWAERGIAPAASTSYRMDDAQVIVPPTAAARKSIQPVVTLTVNGGVRADIKVGQSVKLHAVAEAPPKTGSIVSAEWDFDGTGEYPEHSSVAPKPRVEVSTTHTFSKPGTYFPVVRVASHRNGDAKTAFARVQNLARVRVVVTA